MAVSTARASRRRTASALLVAFFAAAVTGLTGLTGLAGPAAAQAAVTSHPGIFHPLTPARLLDTTAVAGGTVTVTILGRAGVPASGVGAVVLNLTVAAPTRGGFLTAYPTGGIRPATSNLNFAAGQTVPNLAVVPVGSGGRVSLGNASTGRTRVVADISGYYESGAVSDPGALQPLSPARVLDTRSGLGATSADAGPQQTASVAVAGHGGVPASGAAAVVLNVTAATPQRSGYLTVYPSGGSRPATSTLNFPLGRTVANLTIVKLGADGRVNLYNGSSGSTRLVADVFGYVLAGSPTRAGTFQPVTPARILDTRTTSSVPSGATVTLSVDAKGGLPPYGGGADVLNVTVTGASAPGYVTVWPTGQSRPPTSNLNFSRGQTVANLVVVRPSETGQVSLYNASSRAIQLVADASGAFVPNPTIHFRGLETLDASGGAESDVSCVSTSFCMAVTGSGQALRRDASTWSAAVSVSGQSLAAVSCPSTTFCAAVGQGSAATFNGTSWSAAVAIPAAVDLRDVSCVSSTFCLAVDFSSDNAFTFNGTAWSSAIPLPSGGVGYWAGSCASATFCVVIDLSGKATTWNGASFSALQSVGISELSSVSCPTTTFCAVTNELGSVVFLTGAGWGSPTLLNGSADFTVVDCLSSDFCVVGSSQAPDAYTWDGERWTRSTTTPFEPFTLSCGTPSFCVTVSNGAASVGTPV